MQVLAKAVVRLTEALKNLPEAVKSQDTGLATVDVMTCKVEIEQTQQILQEAQKAHDKAMAESYKQLRNLLFGNAQSHWDPVCREMHNDSWAAVNGQVTEGRHLQTWMSFWTVSSYISAQSLVLMQPKGSSSTFSKRCTSPRGPMCNSISLKWKC